MSILPSSQINLGTVKEEVYSNITYMIDFKNKRIRGIIDGKKAVIQAIKKIFATERFSCVIYSGQYGIELASLRGENVGYVISDLPRRIRDALLVDDRIISVENFSFSKSNEKDTLVCSCDVNTIYGDVEVEEMVSI
jgi:hypothetical protein